MNWGFCCFTTSVTRTFEKIFRREKVNAALIEGDSFHRYSRKEMREVMAYQYAAARREGLAVGILPNIKVSLVVQPEEGRLLLPERGWLDPFEWKLAALRALARPYAAWKKRPVPSAREFRPEIPAEASVGN